MDLSVTESSRARHDDVTVRWAEPRDMAAIRRVAERDSRGVPSGRLLVAEVDGTIEAAMPMDGSEAVADPFRPTQDFVDLLELRAAQIATNGHEKGRGVAALWLARRFLAGRRSGSAPRVAEPGLAGR